MEIHFKAVPFDLAFHPTTHLVAAGLITGRIHLYNYVDFPEPQRLWSIRPHKQSCRGLTFANNGQLLISVSPDCSIQATSVETGQPLARLPDAHDAALNKILNLTETTIATGDDEGTIKIWDTRQNSCCAVFQSAHEEYVSDMEFVSESMQLLSVGGDGKLCVSNLRRNRVDARSEFSEEELLSVVRAKNGRKVVCGSQDGVLLLYSWGEFGDCSDRFVGHPNSVEALLKLDEETLISGSSDGLIRLVSILPSGITGVIGEHADFPIESLDFSYDRSVLGSVSHDNVLKLWDLRSCLENRSSVGGAAAGAASTEEDRAGDEDEDEDEDEDDDDEGNQPKMTKKRKGKKKAFVARDKSSLFFSDL